MMTKVWSGAIVGINGINIEIEIGLFLGLPHWIIVGLPDAAVRESKERVRSALKYMGYEFPLARLVVNLAPADIKKEGSAFDLAIALGLLESSEQVQGGSLEDYSVIGELALDGRVKPIKGILPMVMAAQEAGRKSIIVPYDNAAEAAIVRDIAVYPVKNLKEAVGVLWSDGVKPYVLDTDEVYRKHAAYDIDYAEVKGQAFAKRAFEIAAAGGHNILLIGPPGSGKSMLSKRLPTIMPPTNFEEALESTKIHSVLGLVSKDRQLLATRPFRAPHHSVSNVGLVGGGSNPRPGEISMAHNGVLFLDELPEFSRTALEVMRQPMEDGYVTIARASGSMTFPANFMLIAAMNPCPCGFLTDDKKPCTCTSSQIQKYAAKISGPLLDRIDMHVEVPAITYDDMVSERAEESSANMRKRVSEARLIQEQRFKNTRGASLNAGMSNTDLKKYCAMDKNVQNTLKDAVNQLGFSARSYTKIIKIARTIADLEGSTAITEDHIHESVQYRTLDKNIWGH